MAVRRADPFAIPESAWQDRVVEIAHAYHWAAVHFRPARTAHGWRTAGQYDAKGWPDLILCRAPRLLIAELKAEGKHPDSDQREWLAILGACRGIETYLWQPSDLAEVERILR